MYHHGSTIWLWVKTNGTIWGRCATHFRTYFSGDWDVHWGYDLAFDPWPYIFPRRSSSFSVFGEGVLNRRLTDGSPGSLGHEAAGELRLLFGGRWTRGRLAARFFSFFFFFRLTRGSWLWISMEERRPLH